MTTFNQFVTSFVNPFRSKMSEVLKKELLKLLGARSQGAEIRTEQSR
jgi:hypothetical protein